MSQLSDALRSLNQHPVAFYRIYRMMMGSTAGGLVLSQLMYHFSQYNDEIAYRDEDFFASTMVTPHELRMAKEEFKQIPFLTMKRKDVPARLFYTIDWDSYWDFLKEFVQNSKWQECLKQGFSQNKICDPHKTGHETLTKLTYRRE